jgi:hypothetical protein
LPVQPHAGAALPAELAAHVRLDFPSQHLLLDIVDIGADLVGHAVHGVGDFVDDLFQECRDGFDPMAAFEHPPGRIDRTQCLMTAADQKPFRHRKAQKSGFLGRRVDGANQIGKHAVDAVVAGVELLVIVLRDQQIPRQRGNVCRREPRSCAGVGQIEMEPQPAVMNVFDRGIDRQRFGTAIAMQAKRPYQPRNGGSRAGQRRTGELCRVSQHGAPDHQRWTSSTPSGRRAKYVRRPSPGLLNYVFVTV